jgi:hypothetical protein
MIAIAPVMSVVWRSFFRCVGRIATDMMLSIPMILRVTPCASHTDVLNAPSMIDGVNQSTDAPMIAPITLVMMRDFFQRKIGKIVAVIQSQRRKIKILATREDMGE